MAKRIFKGTAKYIQPFKADIDAVCKGYIEGKTLTILSKEFGISESSVSSYLQRKGVKTRNQTDSKRIYPLNHDYFKKIDTEEKAYWLGFIAADGCVSGNTFTLTLSSKDEEHLEKFKNLITPTRVLKYYKSKYSPIPLCLLTFRSKRFVDNLINWGIVPRKTFLLDKLPNIDKNLIPHYIRGYFDGDGSIVVKKHKHSSKYIGYTFSILGNKSFLEEIQNHLIQACDLTKTKINLCKPKKNKITCQYVKGGNPQVYKLLTYLYKDSTIFLTRKYDKFLELKDKVENHTLNKLTEEIGIKIMDYYYSKPKVKHVEKNKQYTEIGNIFGFKPDTIRHFINKNKK